MKLDGRSKRAKDYTGKTFGLLYVDHRYEENIDGKPAWVCQCACGKTAILRSAALRGGQKSCGCLMGIKLSNSIDVRPEFLRHAHSNKLYNQWSGMIYRCSSPTASHFEHYGARGIDVCQEWRESFEAFALWAMDNGYSNGLEIDRINNDLGYTPENCRWIDHKTNSRNRGARRNSKSGHPGITWRPSKTGIGGAWRAGIMVDGVQINLGTFADIQDALQARKAAELQYWGFNP